MGNKKIFLNYCGSFVVLIVCSTKLEPLAHLCVLHHIILLTEWAVWARSGSGNSAVQAELPSTVHQWLWMPSNMQEQQRGVFRRPWTVTKKMHHVCLLFYISFIHPNFESLFITWLLISSEKSVKQTGP